MRKRFNPLGVIIAMMLLFGSFAAAEPASVIEAKVNEAIKQFDKEVKGGEKFLSNVKGYLVFPSVYKGGFVVGGEYGEGALRVNGETLHYYSLASGSIGLQAGLQKRSIIIAFVSETALKSFIRSNGWEAGVDGSITVAKWGIGKDISSISYEKPIYAFVYGEKGLMYNLTFEGTKFTRIIPK
ncbi:putative lipoprotein [hydrothermal vent metagenome]|uniref:Putative lipoprotein n=1 Tax=hydrothermal vent metagenome TaxID=652676 RepID=A0A1W1BGW1_9ZZZZ